MNYTINDKGNEVLFYEKFGNGTWTEGACLDREAGPEANELSWDNLSGEKLEKWAIENGYKDEISKAKHNDLQKKKISQKDNIMRMPTHNEAVRIARISTYLKKKWWKKWLIDKEVIVGDEGQSSIEFIDVKNIINIWESIKKRPR